MAAVAPADEGKPQPYSFDLGHLLCNDPNPLADTTDPANRETLIATTAQGCAQGLINQLLTACPINRSEDGDLQITLPTASTPLPREKPVPKEKEKTKWEKFAEKKGIKDKKKDGKLKFDEALGEWVPKYGYKGRSNGAVSQDWMEEVDEQAEARQAAGEEDANGAGKPRGGKGGKGKKVR
ncbi:hypothetical protein KC343_g4279 [Hortaea werneckii]|uniref:Ribosome biogenesis regulatory protein n=1 Tax=Hortaea werneckii TaxID=91943 RepID=A0A3M7GV69_HORWE|nr:hypothetical protein KC352_g17014 [Hortaea werneckii]KAI7562055.1 hypothetical protein KC317_g8665 [Hortaea werneckii]KAI7631032.1 hypothetical protein KC343_g4279 [Hortaea werneckii]KAI7666098.1 hypothetical protein KC319_g7021 [Hortaea werneckii]KAI7706559.1 hypothetical protein KC322_g5837 [Hortaea werneckii]